MRHSKISLSIDMLLLNPKNGNYIEEEEEDEEQVLISIQSIYRRDK